MQLRIKSMKPTMRDANFHSHAAKVVGTISIVLLGCSTTAPQITLAPSPMTVTGTFQFAASNVPASSGGDRTITVTATNSGGTLGRIQFDGCPVFVRVYRTADLQGIAIYDSGALGSACAGIGYDQTVIAGATVSLPSSTLLAAIVRSQGGGAGRYYLAAVVAPGGISQTLPAGEMDVAP